MLKGMLARRRKGAHMDIERLERLVMEGDLDAYRAWGMELRRRGAW